MQTEHSRALRLAAQATDQAEETLLGQLEASRVILSLDSGSEDCASVATILVDTLRRLPVRLALLAEGLTEEATAELAARAVAIDPQRPLEWSEAAEGDLRVHIGSHAAQAHLYGVAERHGAHVGTNRDLVTRAASASGLGIMTCASLLAGEIFKHVARTIPDRGPIHERLTWCPVTLGPEPSLAPEFERPLEFDLAVVGLGAIGTAVTRILSLLPATGTVALVDPERFAPENLGSYSLGTAEDCADRPWKVDLAARALPELRSPVYRVPVERFVEMIDSGEASWPRLVLSGLDTAVARRETQRLWPDRLLDGATGDTMCGLHDVRAGAGACLMCLFPIPKEGPSAIERLAKATGLAPEVLRYGDQPLSEGHLAALTPDQRQRLEPELGKPVCGLAEAIGLTTLQSDDYRPAVPFVSQQAACLVVGRLLASMLGVARQPGFVQYDTLIGPPAATMDDRSRRPDCFCHERADVISAVRARRAPAEH